MAPSTGTHKPGPSCGASRRGSGGQGVVEYSLILAIMAIACIVSLFFFRDQLSTLLSLIASAV
jgi:Flp pilus assembly pilin Flp